MRHTTSRYWFGLPLSLAGGYVGLFMFMAGDGFELAFLSKFIVSIGFTQADASLVITVYGLAAALSAWASGVIAEAISPLKTMKIGLALWLIFHVLFLWLGLKQANFTLIMLCYALRGIAYPLFCYGFLLMIVQNVKQENVSAASGWFWAAYSLGIGVIGSGLPGLLIPVTGEFNMLCISLLFVAASGAIAFTSLRGISHHSALQNASLSTRLKELPKAATLLIHNRSIAWAFMVRVINQLAVFGFSVIMPFHFMKIGFTLATWLQVWAIFFASTIVFNIFWGIVAEKCGLLQVVRWFGCVGCGMACLLFYYIPLYVGPEYWAAVMCSLLLGFFMAAFVPMTALFPRLAPDHQGAAISIYNLAAGMSNFVAPAIATLALPLLEVKGVVFIYSGCYFAGALITLLICLEPQSRSQVPDFSAASGDSSGNH